ncbi:hypothetical protein DFH07DRAFT_1006638 [Mycena maculata]|uniref:Transmembrane protein n=1 Tax=Mycena maculata TaxID=230809 RepID=A0AAD7HKA6_9AGAR|nr:hypothetical protein DFH07DRAFT_1006638 [Mycena maculata]
MNHALLHPRETVFVSIDNTLGAALIGFAVSCVVFGVLLTQIWTYFGRYNSDTRTYKLLVILILLLEVADQSFIGHFVYHYTVSSIGNPVALLTDTVTWSVIMQQAIGSVVGTIVKWLLSPPQSTDVSGLFSPTPVKGLQADSVSGNNLYITVLLIALSLGQLGVALAFTVKAVSFVVLPKTPADGIQGVGDVLSMSLLCLIAPLLPAVPTPFLTTLLLFDFLPTNFIFGATYFLLSKLYAVSFVATLNTRRAIRGRGTDREKATTTERKATAREQQETDMFALGTRMPTLHEGDEPYANDPYPAFDMIKPVYPPEPARSYAPQFHVV